MKERDYKKEDIWAASQLWAVLVWAAKNRQILNYKHLTPLVNKHWQGAEISLPLGLIKQHCEKNGLRALTVLVVEIETGLPADGLGIPEPAVETQEVFKFVDEEWRYYWDSGKSTSSDAKIFNPGVEEFWRLIPEDQRPEMDF